MSDWTVVVNGVTLDVAHGTVPTLSLPNNGIVNFAVQVDNTNIARDNVAYGNTVVLSFQGTVMVSGYCEAPRKHRDNIIIYGKEQANELTKELILIGGTHHVEYDTTDASAILVAILALKGYTLDAVNRPGAQDISVKFYLKHILYGVEKVASILGLDWYFVGTVCHMVADRGVNRGQIFNFAIRAFDEDYDAIENQIILYYIDDAGDRQYVTGDNAASQGLYGVIQAPYTDYEVFDAVTAQLLADAIAADKGPLQTVIQLVQPIAEVIAHSLGPGDDITLEDAEHGITTAVTYEIRLLTYAGDRAIIEAGTMRLGKTGVALRQIADMAAANLWDLSVDQLSYGAQPWNSDVEFSHGTDPHDDVNWAAGTIMAGDEATQAIDVSTGVHTGLGVGSHYVYWTWGSSTLSVSATYSDGVGADKGIIARLTVSAVAADSMTIETVYSYGGIIGEGTLGPEFDVPATPAGWDVTDIVPTAALHNDGTVHSIFTVTVPVVADATMYAVGWRQNGTTNYDVITSDSNLIVIEGLKAGTLYNLRAASISKLGAYSAWTAAVDKTALGDAAAPGAPTTLVATSKNKAVLLTWDENAETDLDHYEVWMDDGGYAIIAYVRTNYYTWMAASGQLDTAFNFKIKAVDHTGNASGFSNIVAGTAVCIEATDLAIEQRDWKSNISFIWDEANKDWDEIWWGKQGDETDTDATVVFSDGSTVDVNEGTEGALADGEYVYYWDEAEMTGGRYDLQRDTMANYANAVGAGKGLVAMVVINEAGGEPPTFITFNSYLPIISTGILGAYAVFSKNITTALLYGKDIGTQLAVGETNPGIRIIGDLADIVGTAIGDAIGGNFTSGIWGFKAGPIRTYFLDSVSGIMWVYGSGMFGLKTYPGNVIVGYVDASIWDIGFGTGNQNVLVLTNAVADQIVALSSNGRWFAIDGATNNAILDDGLDALIPQTDEGVDLGTNLLQFGAIWGTVKYNDLHLLDVQCHRCGKLFGMNDDVRFAVTAVETLEDSAGTPYDQIRCIPVHSRCSLRERIKRWLHGLRMGN